MTEQHFALVRDGAIVRDRSGNAELSPLVTEKPAPWPGCAWLPVENVDSMPFDLAKHWRLKPVFRVEAKRVVRQYPVVAKSMEHA